MRASKVENGAAQLSEMKSGFAQYDIWKPTTTVGAAPDNDIVIKDRGPDSRHAEIFRSSSDQFWIRDLGSIGGTFVNDRRVEPRSKLNSGDIVRLGDAATFTFLNPPKMDLIPPSLSMKRALTYLVLLLLIGSLLLLDRWVSHIWH